MANKKSFSFAKVSVIALALCLRLHLLQAWGVQDHFRSGGESTALDEYVRKLETNYNYRLVSTIPGSGYTAYLLEMTSQAWLTTNEVDRPLWKHWMTIIKPKEVATSKSLLVIGGGSNGGAPPSSVDPNLGSMAVATKSIITELRQVPNQPLVFAGETEGRKEDSLIAYTWDKYLRTGDTKWPARLPMTKAAVRALDTVTAFCASDEAGRITVDQFFVAGGSKRGWTTWTTAAVDKRVIAIVPFVIDLLNLQPSMLHHYAAYGFWAPSVANYTAFHIMDWTGTPEYAALMKIEEPFSYRSRLTMPKFIINASGDQFFLPDSSQFYFDQLQGAKYLRYVPNADHSLRGSDAYRSLQACYNATIYGLPLPTFSWTKEGQGTLKVTAKDKPSAVKLWRATNPEARDFRIETLGAKWTNSDLSQNSKGDYVAEVSKPEKGWTAFFVELTFPSEGGNEFKFTTEARVVPDILPYKFVPKGKPEAKL